MVLVAVAVAGRVEEASQSAYLFAAKIERGEKEGHKVRGKSARSSGERKFGVYVPHVT